MSFIREQVIFYRWSMHVVLCCSCHTHTHTQTQTHPPEHVCLRDLGEKIGLNLSCTGEQIKILVHFHQLSSSERYFCRARQEIRLLNYRFSQALCHSLLLSYSCSIKLTHWMHFSLPMLKNPLNQTAYASLCNTERVSCFLFSVSSSLLISYSRCTPDSEDVVLNIYVAL